MVSASRCRALCRRHVHNGTYCYYSRGTERRLERRLGRRQRRRRRQQMRPKEPMCLGVWANIHPPTHQPTNPNHPANALHWQLHLRQQQACTHARTSQHVCGWGGCVALDDRGRNEDEKTLRQYDTSTAVRQRCTSLVVPLSTKFIGVSRLALSTQVRAPWATSICACWKLDWLMQMCSAVSIDSGITALTLALNLPGCNAYRHSQSRAIRQG